MTVTPNPGIVRRLRELAGLSVGQLAHAAGISVAYLSQIENGHRENVSPPVMARLATALRVSIADLLDRG